MLQDGSDSKFLVQLFDVEGRSSPQPAGNHGGGAMGAFTIETFRCVIGVSVYSNQISCRLYCYIGCICIQYISLPSHPFFVLPDWHS
jgi:hypothetical protein